jgi:hypothetical protein
VWKEGRCGGKQVLVWKEGKYLGKHGRIERRETWRDENIKSGCQTVKKITMHAVDYHGGRQLRTR